MLLQPVVINNPNPVWARPVTVDYMFQVQQEILVQVYHWDKNYKQLSNLNNHQLMGQARFMLSSLMKASHCKLELPLTGPYCRGAMLQVRAEARSDSRDLFCVQFSGTKLANKDGIMGFFGKSDPFLVINRW